MITSLHRCLISRLRRLGAERLLLRLIFVDCFDSFDVLAVASTLHVKIVTIALIERDLMTALLILWLLLIQFLVPVLEQLI